jgi:hypothetical protein
MTDSALERHYLWLRPQAALRYPACLWAEFVLMLKVLY